MNEPRFKIAWVPWYRPIRLARRRSDNSGIHHDFVGWCWRQKARQVNNLNHGWIAFVEDQTPQRLATCPCCDMPLEK